MFSEGGSDWTMINAEGKKLANSLLHNRHRVRLVFSGSCIKDHTLICIASNGILCAHVLSLVKRDLRG